MMPKKEININRLFLESGNDLEITKGIFVKHPTISDIL